MNGTLDTQPTHDYTNIWALQRTAVTLDILNKLVQLSLDNTLYDDCDSLDVRLQVKWSECTADFSYDLLFGDSQYDLDHRGAWSYNAVTQCDDITSLFNIAISLYDEIDIGDCL